MVVAVPPCVQDRAVRRIVAMDLGPVIRVIENIPARLPFEREVAPSPPAAAPAAPREPLPQREPAAAE